MKLRSNHFQSLPLAERGASIVMGWRRLLLITSVGLFASAADAYVAPVETRDVPINNSPSAANTAPAITSGYDQEQPLINPNTPVSSLSSYPETTAVAPQQHQELADSLAAAASDELTRLDRLEQEVRDLRGQLELQAHRVAQLQSEQNARIDSNTSGQQRAEEGKFVDSSSANSPAVTPATASNSANSEVMPSANLPNDAQVASGLNEQQLTEQKMYQDAYGYLINKQYSKAKPALKGYIQQYPQGEFLVNAHYWLGEISLLEGDVPSATKEFSIVANDHSTSPKAPDAMLKLGFIYADQGQWERARKQLNDIKQKYPQSSVAQLAEQRLKLLDTQGH